MPTKSAGTKKKASRAPAAKAAGPTRAAKPRPEPPVAEGPVRHRATQAGPAPTMAPLHPRDLPQADRETLVGLVQRIFGPDEQAADAAAIDLVDFGPSGAQALLGVMADPGFRRQARGMWALLHALADFLSLEVPPDLQEALVDGAFAYLGSLTHNQHGVAWMVADLLAHHLSDSRGPRMLDRLRAGFIAALGIPAPVVQKAAIYGLAALGDTTSLEQLWVAGAGLEDPGALAYLASTRKRVEAGGDPEVFPVDPE